MVSLLQRFLSIRSGEGALLRAFALLTFTLFFFLTIGYSAVDSLFMAHAGGKMIPYAWIILGLFAIPITPLFAQINATQSPFRIFAGLLAAGFVLILGMWGLAGQSGHAVYLLFYALKELYALFLLSFFWTYLNGYLDTQQAKRFLPVLGAVWSVGDFAGGWLTGVLAHAFGARQLFLVWAAGTLLVFPILAAIEKRFSRASPPTGKPVRLHLGPLVSRVRSTPLLAGLTLMSFLALAVGIAMRYQYYDIFGRAFPQAEDGAAFLGRLRAGVSVFKFATGLFLLPQLVSRMGVRNVLLLYPIGMTLTLLALAVYPGITTAGLGFFVIVGMGQAIYDPSLNLTFNLLSPGERTTLRAFFAGIMNPLGALVISGLLLSITLGWLPFSATAVISLCFAGALMGATWIVRRSYIDSVLRGLQLGRGLLNRQDQGPIPKAWVAELEQRWSVATTDEKLLIMDFFLGRGREQPFFVDAASRDADPQVRIALCRRATSRWMLRPEIILGLLSDAEPRVRAAAARYAASVVFDETDALLPLLQDPDPEVRAEAAVSLWSIGDLSNVSAAVQELDRALNSNSGDQIPALLALGRLGDPKYLRTVIPFSGHDDPAVRRAAAKSVRSMAAPSAKRWVGSIAVWLQQTRGQERIDLIETLAVIGGPLAAQALLKEAEKKSSSHFFRLRDALLKIGEDARIPCLSALTDRERSLEIRILALSVLNHLQTINRKLLLQLAQESLAEALHLTARARTLALRRDPGFQVLTLLYQEQALHERTFLIRLLFAWNRYHGVRWVEHGIRSHDRVVRANAIEALVNLTPASLRVDLMRLLDSESRFEPVDVSTCLREAAAKPGRLWVEAAEAAMGKHTFYTSTEPV